MRKQLFVFDLDFTLWDAGGTWCDCTYPPYKKHNGNVYDSAMAHIRLYPDVIDIFETLLKHKKKIAVASRTSAKANAKQLMELLNIAPYVHFEEIFPGSKIQHFNNIRENSGIDFTHMVFFDDEQRNIDDVSGMNVECNLVRNGVQMSMISPYL